VNDELHLLVEWSSPWEEFRSAIRPAFERSPQRLAGEAQTGLFPYRGMVATWGAEILLFVLLILLTRGFDSLHPNLPPSPAKYDVIYYTGNELPNTADAGGAHAGRSGRSGGREARHPTQTIRVARGEVLREKVVDAPNLKLPRSDSAVANLLAYKRIPGPPPAEGLKSSRAPVVAPQLAAVPPSPELERDQMRSAPALAEGVVPPAPTAENVASLRLPGSHPIEVVPPPVSAPEQITNQNPRLSLPAPSVVAPAPTEVTRELSNAGPGFGPGELRKQVVPPPVQIGSATSQERRNVSGFSNAAVVPPPVQIGGAASQEHRNASGLGNSAVVPPPVQIGSGSLSHQSVNGLGGGTGVVPPPPTVSSGSSLSGRGRGSRGMGLGGAGDVGEVAAPANSGGNGKGTGIVVSNQPGSKVGVPGTGGSGSLAMSPAGGANPGLGGAGGGTSIGRGKGTGSGFSGAGPGGGKDSSGPGSDPMAHGGISPGAGPGGSGSGTNGSPAVPGVSVRGGNSGIVNLPSFGTEGTQLAAAGRSSVGSNDHPTLTIEATPRSGGAFNFYGRLKGDKVYTIYINTVLGTAVLEFADPTSAEHPSDRALAPPQPLRADLPAGVRRSRLVIACVLDREGLVRNAQVIESSGPAMAAKVLAALPGWKFRPATRGNQTVEVDAILGFDIDTSDRY
jgi:hypothetical protein